MAQQIELERGGPLGPTRSTRLGETMAERPPRPTFDDGTETLVRAPPRPRPLGAVISVDHPHAVPRAFRLTADTCVVGSAPGCQVVIAETTVSRQHVELSLVPEGVSVRDLGSRNGVFYLGQRVEKITLALGGRIHVGAVPMLIDVDTEALAAVPALEH